MNCQTDTAGVTKIRRTKCEFVSLKIKGYPTKAW
jgi:hypothetical protein